MMMMLHHNTTSSTEERCILGSKRRRCSGYQEPSLKRFKGGYPVSSSNNLFQSTNTTSCNKMTNDDILGDPVPFHKMESLRKLCNQVLDLNPRGPPRFPGSHPVSLTHENLQLLRQRYYRVSWKADGTRYLLLVTWDGCYLIDRKFDFRRVDMRFPHGYTNEGCASANTHHYTLLDGEMVIDTDPTTHKQERRFLAYDIIALNGKSLIGHPFGSRYNILENEVIKPRNMERHAFFKTTNPYYRYDLEPFRIRKKEFYPLSDVPNLLQKFIPSLSHAADGLIFQCWDDPYVPLTHAGLLKWKYPHMNSVDFQLEVGTNNRPILCLNARGRRRVVNGSRGTFRDSSVDIYSLSGKIIECSWDSEENAWVFMRMRPDKSAPNEFITFNKVLSSIQDNITQEDVIKDIKVINQLPIYADQT